MGTPCWLHALIAGNGGIQQESYIIADPVPGRHAGPRSDRLALPPRAVIAAGDRTDLAVAVGGTAR